MAADRLSLVFGALADPNTWLARYQRFWDESHERLDDLLAALLAEQEQKGSDDEQD
jgi:hypothetical protein